MFLYQLLYLRSLVCFPLLLKSVPLLQHVLNGELTGDLLLHCLLSGHNQTQLSVRLLGELSGQFLGRLGSPGPLLFLLKGGCGQFIHDTFRGEIVHIIGIPCHLINSLHIRLYSVILLHHGMNLRRLVHHSL